MVDVRVNELPPRLCRNEVEEGDYDQMIFDCLVEGDSCDDIFGKVMRAGRGHLNPDHVRKRIVNTVIMKRIYGRLV